MENGVVNIVNHLEGNFAPSIGCLESYGRLKEKVRRDDAEVICFGKKPGLRPTLVFQLAKLLRAGHYDIVHTHNHLTLAYGLPAAVLGGVPVVIHGEHGTPMPYNVVHRLMYRFFARGIASILCVAEPLKREIVAQRRVHPEKITVIPNGVDTKVFRPMSKNNKQLERFGLNLGDFVIGSVGRLDTVKSYPLMVEIIHRLRRRHPQVKGLLIGDGPDRSAIEAAVSRWKLKDHFILAGERNEIPEMIALMDLFLLTSSSEGMSNTLLEAMSCGKPVVAANVGNNSELVQRGLNGFLVDSRSADAFVRRLSPLIGDPAQVIAMGKRSRDVIGTNFSLDLMVRRYECHYRTLYALKAIGA